MRMDAECSLASFREGVLGQSSCARPYWSTNRTLGVRRSLRRDGETTVVPLTESTSEFATGPSSFWLSPLADMGAGEDDSMLLKEGSDMDSEAPWPCALKSQFASGKETSTLFLSSFAVKSGSDTALSEGAASNRTFIRLFRRSEPGVESHPPGGAGVRAGSVLTCGVGVAMDD
jgi:hypothetical protein